MKFLVVGASGFVGRNVLAHVKSLGFAAAGTQSRSREPGLVTFDLLRHRIADCVERLFFQQPEQTCVVICAFSTDMDLCWQKRQASRQINVEKIIQLVEDVRALGARPIFLSSCFVFDGKVGYYMENHPLSPANEYGQHKAEVENHLRVHVPEAFVARLDKIVGDNPAEDQLFAHWYKCIVAEQPIVCIQGSLLSPTYVRDVARAIVLACQKDLRGVYHVANSEFFYREELARQFCYALGKPPSVVARPLHEFNFPANRALKSYLDGSHFAKTTGMTFTSMREVFREFHRRAAELS